MPKMSKTARGDVRLRKKRARPLHITQCASTSKVVLLMPSPVVLLFKRAEGHEECIHAVAQQLEVVFLHFNT